MGLFLSSCGGKPLQLYFPDEGGFCRSEGKRILCVGYKPVNRFLCARAEDVQAFGFACRNRRPLPPLSLCSVENRTVICESGSYPVPSFDFMCMRDAMARQWIENCAEVSR